MADSAPQQTFGSTEARTAFAGNNFSGNNQFTIYGPSSNSVEPEAEKYVCLRSLGFSEMRSRQQDILRAEPGTCDWLFSTPEFRAWRNPDRLHTHYGVFWIKGKPGAGKSTLMRHALYRYQEDLFKDYLVVAYFFNARGDKLERSPLGFLRSIVYQLVDHSSELCELFKCLLREKKMLNIGAEIQWRLSELQDFVHSIIRKRACSRPLLLLVDALDECNESDVRDVVSFLESLTVQAKQTGHPLRICLSSRHYPTVRMTKCVELVVEKIFAHQVDIEVYIKEKLRTPDVSTQTQIAERANGIFLWVVIVVSLLNKVYDEGRVEEMQQTLMDIPDSLEKLFSGILDSVTDASETLAILKWVLLSERPLRIQELFAAVTQVATSDIERMKRRITTSSKGLVEMRNDDSQTVQFIHLSVNDFLFRQQRLRILDSTLGDDPITASHGWLWARCRDSVEMAITTKTSRNDLEQAMDKDPFLRYAACYILHHAELAIADTSRSEYSHQQVCIEQWLQRSDHWFDWVKGFRRAIVPNKKFARWPGMGFPHFLARHGFLNLVRASLVGADVDIQDDYQRTVLQAACIDGCTNATKIIEWLLAAGANVNAQGGRYGNALQVAAFHGRGDSVKVLLAAGADVNAQGGYYGSAIQAAAFRGRGHSVKLLLSAGANVNVQGGEYGTALQAAAIEGSQDIIERLVAAGADVKAQGGFYGNPLQAAAIEGSRDNIEALLTAGANVNAQGGCYGNALQAAALDKSRDNVEILLTAGAEVNAQGGVYGSALQAGALGGSRDNVEALLAAGANVNAQGGYYGNALQAAAFEGSRDNVNILLAAGANVNTQCGRFGSALQAAAFNRHRDIVRTLLEAGADVHTQGGKFGNALQAACSNGIHEEEIEEIHETEIEEIIKLLVATGADPSLLRFDDIPLQRQKLIERALKQPADYPPS